MKDWPNEFEADGDIERAAASWTLKIDRGLTPEEQDSYVQWLAKDPKRREAMRLFQWGWGEFDRLSGLQASRHAPIDPNLLAPGSRFSRPSRLRRIIRFGGFSVPAAAAIAWLVFWGLGSRPQQEEVAANADRHVRSLDKLSRIEKLRLSDGSEVELNRGASVEPLYTLGERRVRLLSGEANFKVAKDPDRPFVVEVDDVLLRALGTVFNVRAEDRVVDLIVTEGRVRVERSSIQQRPEEPEPVVTVGQRALMLEDENSSRLEVIDLDPVKLEEALLWQPRLLDFDAAPLTRIVEEFNRRNQIKIIVEDPALESLSLSCSFWSDNVEGFVRLLEMSFGLEALRQGDDILLGRDV